MALIIIIGLFFLLDLLYLLLTEHANVLWTEERVVIVFQGFPETWKWFQGFSQGKKNKKQKGSYRHIKIEHVLITAEHEWKVYGNSLH